jgi:hypothetical protein
MQMKLMAEERRPGRPAIGSTPDVTALMKAYAGGREHRARNDEPGQWATSGAFVSGAPW